MQWTEAWSNREQGGLKGYGVDAIDGSIGKLDDATLEVGPTYVIVDTGHWLSGKRVLLPSATIAGVDEKRARLRIDRTKDEIRHAPEWIPHGSLPDLAADYHGPRGHAVRDWDDHSAPIDHLH